MSNKLFKLWQDQIANELGSANVYLAVASHFDKCGLEGLSAFFQAHAKEENSHAVYLYDFMLKSGNFPMEISAIPAASTTFKSCSAAMEAVVAHERLVTDQINAIATAAAAENDHAAYSAIQHLVDEQVEELDWSTKLLLNVQRAESSNTLHLLDQTYSK